MKAKTFIIIGSVIGLAVAVSLIFNCTNSGRTCGLRGSVMKQSFMQDRAQRSEVRSVLFRAGEDADAEVFSTKVASVQVNAAVSAPITKKLIKNAYVMLKVKDCAKVKDAIVRVVEKRNGTVMNAELEQAVESRKSGKVIFKVRPDELDAVLADVKQLGKVKSESVTVNDVTETYVDLQARLTNLKLVRDRFVNLLNEKAKQVKDIVEIEKELARVGGEIAAMEGRLKYLDFQIDLSTVTVNFFENPTCILQDMDLGAKFQEALRTAASASVNAVYAIIVLVGLAIPFAVVGAGIWGIVVLAKKRRSKK